MECFKDFLDTVDEAHPIHKDSKVFHQCCEMLDYQIDSWWLKNYLVSVSKLRQTIEDMELKTEEEKEICAAFTEMLKANHLMWSAVYKRDFGNFSDQGSSNDLH